TPVEVDRHVAYRIDQGNGNGDGNPAGLRRQLAAPVLDAAIDQLAALGQLPRQPLVHLSILLELSGAVRRGPAAPLVDPVGGPVLVEEADRAAPGAVDVEEPVEPGVGE